MKGEDLEEKYKRALSLVAELEIKYRRVLADKYCLSCGQNEKGVNCKTKYMDGICFEPINAYYSDDDNFKRDDTDDQT